ncbi:pilus assembly protein TadG-related protein [Marinobacter shengliensis]|uniref:pilus assembly protein TadG-related protein n=1 Tax=Marinobacter shengliensis TaxID=1389223 RepID=UPI001109CCFA|nr:pilus assembly protein TadG-related protein [Marinobacter shengliensis]
MINFRQRGVLLVATPLLLVLVAIFTALLIDGARLLLVKSEMQSIVNSAATAAADEAHSCSGLPATFSTMQARGLQAARAVGFDGDDSELEIIPGLLFQQEPSDGPLEFLPRNASSEMAQTNASWVRYTRTEPVSALLPERLFPPITLVAESAARKEVYAILSSQGATATIEGGLLGSLVGELIGAPGYSLDATSLQSLESTLVGVGDLLTSLGVNDLAELADEPLLDVLDALIGITGGTTSQVGSILDDLTAAAGLSGLNASAVFEVVGQPPDVSQSSFPLYDFVISVVLNSARALNTASSSLLSVGLDTSNSSLVSGLVQSIGLLGDLDVTLGLIVDEPPKIVIGPARQDTNGIWLTTVRSSDITLQTAVDIELATGFLGDLISTLSLGLLQVSLLDNISIPLAVSVGGGQATLVNANCAKGSLNQAEFDFLVQDGVTNIQTGTVNGATGVVTPKAISATILELKPLLLPAVNVCLDADLEIDVSTANTTQALESYELYCPAGQCEINTISTSDTGLSGLDVQVRNVALDCGQGGLTGVISTVLGGLAPPLTALLSNVTEPLIRQLVSPLLAALGADIGGMQLRVLGAEQTGSQLVEQAVFVR